MSLRLRGERAIGQAVEAARGFGTRQQMAEEELARLCIVVEELIANLYDHGGVTAQEEVQLTLRRDARGIRLCIVDPGTPFNAMSAPPGIGHATRGGGAGVRLVQAWAELVSYSSSNEGNRLELLLPFGRKG